MRGLILRVRGLILRVRGLILLGGMMACGLAEPASEPERRAGLARGRSRVGESIVSTVDGHGIRIAEVAAMARRTGLAPNEALRALQEERLLAQEAERRGYGVQPAVLRSGRQAIVQALLAELERDHPPNAVASADVAELVAAQPAVVPERRRATHLLVSGDLGQGDHAREVAERIRAQVEREGLEVVRAEHRPGSELEGLSLRIQDLPLLADDGTLEAEFVRPLFAAAGEGVLPEVVRTSHGWHVVVVTEIAPERRLHRRAQEEEARAQLTTRARSQAAQALVQRLQETLHVERFESAIMKAVERDAS